MKTLFLLAGLTLLAGCPKDSTVLPLVGQASGTSAAQPVTKVVPLSGTATAHSKPGTK